LHCDLYFNTKFWEFWCRESLFLLFSTKYLNFIRKD
jgi:hypothetical protein